ncbi:109R [Invertebrate iridescent virus Kaz2018]|nr:109R [Invertebrate iridescent virus Kaz2018]
MISNFQYYFINLKTISILINERIALLCIYFINYTYRMFVFKQRC